MHVSLYVQVNVQQALVEVHQLGLQCVGTDT